jgi:hypothetical protein
MGRPDPRFAGVALPAPEFADDDGGADPRLAAALQRHAAGAPVRYEVLVALATARLLVPVVAVLDSDHGDGPLREEKDSHMATVTLVNADGRRGLLAFTSTAALRAWRTDARPVAASAPRVGRAALDEGADAVLLDAAGPVPYAVEGAALVALAAGAAYHPVTDPAVAAAVRAVVDRVRPGAALAVGDGRPHGCDLLVEVALDPEQAARLGEALAADATLRSCCQDGIAVTTR